MHTTKLDEYRVNTLDILGLTDSQNEFDTYLLKESHRDVRTDEKPACSSLACFDRSIWRDKQHFHMADNSAVSASNM